MTPDIYEAVDGLDINATDKVYRNPQTERHIKVRLTRVAAPPGAPSFGQLYYHASGAGADAAGKALRLADGRDGWQIAPASAHTITSHEAGDLLTKLEEIRRLVAVQTEKAVALEEQANA